MFDALKNLAVEAFWACAQPDHKGVLVLHAVKEELAANSYFVSNPEQGRFGLHRISL